MLELKNFLDPANVIDRGSDISTLKECLAFAIGNRHGHFNYMRPFLGMDFSIRVFGEKPFEGSASFHRPLSPEELALILLEYSNARREESRARYSVQRDLFTDKGWAISRSADDVDEEGNPLIAAYATWVD